MCVEIKKGVRNYSLASRWFLFAVGGWDRWREIKVNITGQMIRFPTCSLIYMLTLSGMRHSPSESHRDHGSHKTFSVSGLNCYIQWESSGSNLWPAYILYVFLHPTSIALTAHGWSMTDPCSAPTRQDQCSWNLQPCFCGEGTHAIYISQLRNILVFPADSELSHKNIC